MKYSTDVFLFLAALGLRCYEGFPLDVASRGHSSFGAWFLIAVASLILWNTGYARHVGVSNCSTWAP